MRKFTLMFLFLILGLSSCKDERKGNKTKGKSEKVISDLQVDHFNIWVENPKKQKND